MTGVSRKRARPTASNKSTLKAKSRTLIKQVTSTPDKKITDFFPIRKSNRITGKALETERMKQLEELVITGANEGDLEVAMFEGKGRGLRALRMFSRGEFVVEYKGDIVDYTEAIKREAEYAENPKIGSYMYFFKYQERRMCVDATAETIYKGRLLNHSVLKPNLRPKVLDFGTFICVGLFAMHDIEPGEELVYDYGDRSSATIEKNPWLLST
ncbi:SET domain containing protein, protein [Aphelenchoides bicaudatus]|nr:SET domain containing protein, protein [Aphelenchoides bicaudatus]